MAKKTTREIIDSSLKRLKAEVPPDFAPDPSSPLHENLQRFVASGLAGQKEKFDAELRSNELVGLFTVRSKPYATRDGRRWTEVLRVTDVHRVLGVFDEGSDDPMIHVADVETLWDDSANVPLPGGARRLCTLAELLPKIKRRKVEAPSKATPAPLETVEWTGDWSIRTYEPLLDGGRQVIAVLRQPPREGVAEGERPQALCLMDGKGMEALPFEATHSNYVAAGGWVGESIAVLGQRRNVLTHIGVLDRGQAWTAREVWKMSPDDPGARLFVENTFAGEDGVFAFATRASREAQECTVHVWQRNGDAWVEIASEPVPSYVQDLYFQSPTRLTCVGYEAGGRTARELVIGQGTVVVESAVSDRCPAAPVRLGEGLLASATAKPGSIAVFRDGALMREIALPKDASAILAGGPGWLIAVVKKRTGESLIQGWVVRGDECVPWFEHTEASVGSGRHSEAPQSVKATDTTLFVYYGVIEKALRRMALPPLPEGR